MLNVFFPPKTLEIIVERPESRIKEGQYDRTTEYIGDKLKQLTQSPRNVNGLEVPRRKSPASRNERIKLVIAGELVRLKCVAGSIQIQWQLFLRRIYKQYYLHPGNCVLISHYHLNIRNFETPAPFSMDEWRHI